MTDPRYLEEQTLGEAWLQVVETVRRLPGRAATNVALRILEPSRETPRIRDSANNLLKDLRLPPVETVRNTIFPLEWARKWPRPSDLADEYRRRYEKLRKFPGNHSGTYFGRLVELNPSDKEPVDQLTNLTEKLLVEKRLRGPMSSRYELAIYDPVQDRTGRMGFPCLSFISLHLVQGRLDLMAHYRNEYLIERAYGNYLGLAELLTYLATATKLGTGEMLITLGHAQVEKGSQTKVAKMLKRAGLRAS